MLEFLTKKLEKKYGKELTENIRNGYEQSRKVTFRVNKIKSNTKEVKDILIQNKINFENVSWYQDAFILDNENEENIRKLSIYNEGKIYLQSLSSMLPPIILNPKENTDILDMTAAPGSKTTQIASITQNKANITACEMNKIRAEKLKFNIQNQGANSVFLMQKDARNIDDFFAFDQILLDAPCSGSGTISFNNKNIEKYFTEELINKSIKSQIALLRKAIKILKNNGEIVYSTCSILEEENEQVVQKIINEFNTNILKNRKQY